MTNPSAMEVSVQDVELESVEGREVTGPNLLNGNLDMIKNVKVHLEIRVGDAQVTVGDLLGFRQGSVIQLNQSITAPVQVLLDGQVVAMGELSVVGDNFGVRITEQPK